MPRCGFGVRREELSCTREGAGVFFCLFDRWRRRFELALYAYFWAGGGGLGRSRNSYVVGTVDGVQAVRAALLWLFEL